MAKTDPKARLIDAALKLLGKRRWSDITLREIARAARLPFASLEPVAPDKPALFGLIVARFATETGKRYKAESKSDNARDRLLDVCLTFFETIGARKAALRSMYESLRRDPFALASARAEIVKAASWLLALAEADSGPALQIRAVALAGIVARAIPAWLDDDKSMSKTMAQLDKDLRRSEFLFRQASRADDD